MNITIIISGVRIKHRQKILACKLSFDQFLNAETWFYMDFVKGYKSNFFTLNTPILIREILQLFCFLSISLKGIVYKVLLSLFVTNCYSYFS